MIKYLVQLHKYRELLWVWTLREVRIRYKQTLLGAAWAILQPLGMMIIFTLVFSILTRVPTTGIPYPLFAYTALLPWTLLATAITFGSNSLITHLNLVTKTYFPREILPLGAVGASFFDFLIASTIFILMLFYYKVQLTWSILWIPLILSVQTLLMIGLTLLSSAIIVYYRDIRFIVPMGLQIWLFATPVVYPIDLVPKTLLPIYMLNPMAGIIETYRQVILVGHPPEGWYFLWSTISGTILFIYGYHQFKKLERQFADII